MAQASLDIGGEIETQIRFDLDKTKNLWSRVSLKLKLDSQVGPDAHGFANIKIYMDEKRESHPKLNEAYVDYYGDKFDLRGGLQVISWGTAYKINPTDVINPIDLTEEEVFIAGEKLGVIATRLNYYPLTNLTLTVVFIPYFVPSLQPPGAVLPETKLDSSEYALRAALRSIGRSDLSFIYFKGKEDFPSINGEYRDVKIYGTDIIGTIGGLALWAEGAYKEPDAADSSYEVVAGGEYTFENDLYLMGQLYHRDYSDGEENYLMTVMRYPFRDIHTLQLGMVYSLENEAFVVFPEVTISLANALSLVLKGAYINGDTKDTIFEQLTEQASLQLKYSF